LRQKEYVADLEEKLRHLQHKGVEATKEVQASARRVVKDNVRLRALLRAKGVDDATIDTWTPEGMECEDVFQPPPERCDRVEAVGSVRFLLATPEVSRVNIFRRRICYSFRTTLFP
jgi:hypothetical protein